MISIKDELELYFKNIPHVNNYVVLGIKDNNNIHKEWIALILETCNDLSLEEQNEINNEINKAMNKLPKGIEINKIYYTHESLPKANDMKVKRMEVKKQIELHNQHTQWGYVFLVLGILSFAVYAAVFKYFGEGALLFRAISKVVTNVCFIVFAVEGAMVNKSLRNRRMILVLTLYAIGDVLAIFTLISTGITYLIGHLLLIYSLYVTVLITKKNISWFIGIIGLSFLIIIALFKWNLNASYIYLAYAFILASKIALTISSPTYLIASIVFSLSDIVGLLRTVFFGSSVYIFNMLTLVVYYVGIILYAFTTYRYEAKPVVTWRNMTVLARNLTRAGVHFCFTQGWGKDIAAGKYLAMHSDAYIAANINDKAKMEKILTKMEYEITECFDEFNLYVYYSELFGYLNISLREFTSNGVILGKKEYQIMKCPSIFLKEGIPAILTH